MDALKPFPTILLDLISKIVPGSVVVFVFQNRYLPPSEFVLAFMQHQPDSDWISWGRIVVASVTAYAVGTFIAILSNWLDAQLVKRHWYHVLVKDINAFIFSKDQPPGLKDALASPSALVLFVDHCRGTVETRYPASAAVLERYRTAYRLFVGVTLILVALPLSRQTLWSMTALLGVVVFALLAFFMSRRLLHKSLQMYTLALASAPAPATADSS